MVLLIMRGPRVIDNKLLKVQSYITQTSGTERLFSLVSLFFKLISETLEYLRYRANRTPFFRTHGPLIVCPSSLRKVTNFI